MPNPTWSALGPAERQAALKHILLSESAGPNPLARDLSVGIDFLADFWYEHYLSEYIPSGGSKIKFVTGRTGTGKTLLLDLLTLKARELGYVTVNLSARNFMLNDFREVYLEILNHVDLQAVFDALAKRCIEELGVDVSGKPENISFTDYLVNRGEMDAIIRMQIRDFLRTNFLHHPLMDNNFGLCCSIMVGDRLGHPSSDDVTKDIVMGWLHSDKTQKLATIKAVGLAPYKITRFNARHLLRSLAVLVHLAGYPGILVTIDHLDTILNLSGLDEMKYTPKRRMDTYESIRQLIDDIDSLHNIMFVYAFDRELMDNGKIGIPSYSALMMRIQNEIQSDRFNRFTDIANLDKLAQQEYTAEKLVEMTKRMCDVLPELLSDCPEVSPEAVWRRNGLSAMIPKTLPAEWPHPISLEEAEALISNESFGGIGLVRRALQLALGLRSPESKTASEADGEEEAPNV